MTYLITGGGSGGHIYPALAVADEIKLKNPDARIVLVGARRGMERSLFLKTNYKAHFLPVGQLHSSVGRKTQVISLFMLPFCFVQSLYLMLRYRPKAVLGVGGYASGPLGVVSSVLGVPTYVWEANATPGVTNRILGKFNTTPLLVFPDAAKYFKKKKPIMTGLPIRPDLEEVNEVLKMDKGSFLRVLFVGGSQGARIFNEVVPRLLALYKDKLSGVHITHQTGLKNYESVVKAYEVLGIEEDQKLFRVLPYLDPIKTHYALADVVVCRSGASTVVELSVMEKPSVLVPFPKASDDHQRTNAQSMVSKGASLMIEEANFTPETLFKELLSLKENPDKLSRLSKASKSAFPLGAREKIADILLSHEH